jgi:hypothetical protein
MHATNFDYEKIGNSAELKTPSAPPVLMEKLETRGSIDHPDQGAFYVIPRQIEE